MRKLLALFSSLTLLVPLALAETSFSDVDSSNPNEAAILALAEQGVLGGYEDGTFLPEQEVNRAEAVKIILLGLDEEVNTESIAAAAFTDVSEEDWFFAEVGTALSLGIVKGYDDGEFKAGNTVNKAEAVKMLLATAGVEIEEDPELWYLHYMDYAMEVNIMPLETDGEWHPEAAITRGAISEMVYRMQYVQENGGAFPENLHWPMVDLSEANVSLQLPFGWSYSDGEVAALWLLDESDGVSIFDPGSNGVSVILSNSSSGEVSEGEVVALSDGSYLHVMEYLGAGPYSATVAGYVDLLLGSATFLPTDPDPGTDDILEAIREGVQVDGQGTILMALMDDWELIETDSIGVGTGPVDYYYSPTLNYTLKYERSFDVVLALQEGSTSAF